MTKLKKALTISLIAVILFVIVVIAGISPLTKYLVEKYDQRYTGREIKMDWAYVNPFTGYLHFSNLKIFEFEKDSIFFSASGVSANFAMRKLLLQTYELSELTINEPKGLVLQNKNDFNFNDLVEKFSSKKEDGKKKEALHLNILNIKIKDGEFYYKEQVTPINYFIKHVNLTSAGIRWDVDTIPVKFSFLSGPGVGDMKGEFSINTKNKDYTLAVVINKFDLNIVGQYIKDLSNYGNFKAILDADFKSTGNLIDREDLTNSGNITISNFHFGKDSLNDFAAFDALYVSIKEVSPKKLIYKFDSISLLRPFLEYERYDYLDNVETMFGAKGAKVKAANAEGAKFNLVIELAKYVQTISKNLLHSNYQINRLAVYDGELRYNDYSLTEKFAVALDPFTFIADSVDKTHPRVNFELKAGIKPFGDCAIDISINPKDSSDFDLRYQLQKIPLSIFNPYLIKYTSFPVDRGTLEIKGLWTVRNGNISSTNHLVIIDPRIGEKSVNKNTSWIPFHLAMFVVRERGNVIDYEVPIVGNLRNPKFKLGDVFFDAIENVFVKPPTTPYRIEVKNSETAIEKSLSLKWEMRNCVLSTRQANFLNRLSDFLKENPEARILVKPNRYELKEKEYLLFYEAKKSYFLQHEGITSTNFQERDSMAVERMSVKDPLFVDFLNKRVHDTLLFTVQDKCQKFIGKTLINAKFSALNEKRFDVFMAYFKKHGTEKQVKMANGENSIPYNGFSFYEINYEGDYPDYLVTAYQKMLKLDNEVPRNKFKKVRQKISK